MRHIHRSFTAVVLILVLALPATAATTRTSRTRDFIRAAKRYIIRAISRISPPGGVQEPEEPISTTTDPEPTTKVQ
jgi:hypothetical protein